MTSEELHLAHITTYPDNLDFQTGDVAVVRRTNDWSKVKDGDFILIKNEIMEVYDDNMLRVTFNKGGITLSPTSSYIPFEERDVPFDEMKSIKLTGKVLGVVRSFSNEFKTDSFSIF